MGSETITGNFHIDTLTVPQAIKEFHTFYGTNKLTFFTAPVCSLMSRTRMLDRRLQVFFYYSGYFLYCLTARVCLGNGKATYFGVSGAVETASEVTFRYSVVCNW